MHPVRMIVCSGILSCLAMAAQAQPSPTSPAAKQEAEHLDNLPPVRPPSNHIDHSGRKQAGRASFYGKEFYHKKMANGRKMNPNAAIAASKSLPLGSVAKVTNLENGQSTTVRIEDRGPYVPGRIIDLAPKAADDISLKKQGVAPVEVKPITVPTSDGRVKLGAGAAEASSKEVEKAVETTQQLAVEKEASRN